MPNTADFIWVKPNSLSPSFCRKIIKKFEAEPNKFDGAIGTDNRVDKTVKDTKDFTIPVGDKGWKDDDDVFFNALKVGLSEYELYLNDLHQGCLPAIYNIKDTGYKIQRYEPNGFYSWHNDFRMDGNGTRIHTFMWYLNTLRKKDEGYTEFLDGTRLQPKCGSLVLFPATWSHAHRGYPPKVRKYICNGWLTNNYNGGS